MTVSRRSFLQSSTAAAAAAAIGLDLSAEALAKAPLQDRQAPGFYRIKIGEVEVTSLIDGALELELQLFPQAEAAREEAEALLRKAGRPKAGTPGAINGFVVNTGEKLFLVDTGAGAFFGPQAGWLEENLKAAGYEPRQVDAVILTHMHPDHIGGLFSGDGTPLFPEAQVLVSEADFAFWTDETRGAQAPDSAKPFFQLAAAAGQAYGKRIEKFADGFEPASGLTLMSAAGHTPGHSMLRISSGGESLLIWGDIIHAGALQFARPEWAIAFDTDQDQAIATRRKVLDMAAGEELIVAGGHLDFPGMGRVVRDGAAYRYSPIFWAPRI
jgi:glyoxylase-like metal-dependent hydrolase (beta-lactamase superfamily II)